MVKKQSILLKRLIFVLLLAWIGYVIVSKKEPAPTYIAVENMVLIAHAGGGLPQGDYSNAREAFDLSAKNGFLYIEVDFNWATNGDLILIHDWGPRYYQYFSRFSAMPQALARRFPKQATTREDFLSKSMNHGLHQMDIPLLLEWLRAHPNVRIVTDVKNDNVKALRLIKDKAGHLQNRFIAQIYEPQEYERVTALGYTDIIFTTYRSPLSIDALISFAQTHKLFAMTVPQARASVKLANALEASQTPLFTHTINSTETAQGLREKGIDGLYTDYLYPSRLKK